ncbi:LysE family translocator [Streptomyces sp. NPDC050560]|uniref:LysE family translocator n=1 Tax=Streptomyces sp. NPDC050560 TaxID=3365630 RepID=UPI0037926B28
MHTLPSLHAFLGIAGVALGMVLLPGPNMVYLVSRSLSQGRRAGLVSLLGVLLGFVGYLVAVTAGIAAVFAAVPVLYTGLKLAGALYLLRLAVHMVRPGGRAVFEARELPPDSPRRLFTMGLLTCLLNPKIALMYLSLLPQFVDPTRGHVGEQSLLLGLTQIAVAVSVNGAIAVGAAGVAGFLSRRPAWLRLQRRLMGTALAVFAVRLATDRSSAAV